MRIKRHTEPAIFAAEAKAIGAAEAVSPSRKTVLTDLSSINFAKADTFADLAYKSEISRISISIAVAKVTQVSEISKESRFYLLESGFIFLKYDTMPVCKQTGQRMRTTLTKKISHKRKRHKASQIKIRTTQQHHNHYTISPFPFNRKRYSFMLQKVIYCYLKPILWEDERISIAEPFTNSGMSIAPFYNINSAAISIIENIIRLISLISLIHHIVI